MRHCKKNNPLVIEREQNLDYDFVGIVVNNPENVLGLQQIEGSQRVLIKGDAVIEYQYRYNPISASLEVVEEGGESIYSDNYVAIGLGTVHTDFRYSIANKPASYIYENLDRYRDSYEFVSLEVNDNMVDSSFNLDEWRIYTQDTAQFLRKESNVYKLTLRKKAVAPPPPPPPPPPKPKDGISLPSELTDEGLTRVSDREVRVANACYTDGTGGSFSVDVPVNEANELISSFQIEAGVPAGAITVTILNNGRMARISFACNLLNGFRGFIVKLLDKLGNFIKVILGEPKTPAQPEPPTRKRVTFRIAGADGSDFGAYGTQLDGTRVTQTQEFDGDSYRFKVELQPDYELVSIVEGDLGSIYPHYEEDWTNEESVRERPIYDHTANSEYSFIASTEGSEYVVNITVRRKPPVGDLYKLHEIGIFPVAANSYNSGIVDNTSGFFGDDTKSALFYNPAPVLVFKDKASFDAVKTITAVSHKDGKPDVMSWSKSYYYIHNHRNDEDIEAMNKFLHRRYVEDFGGKTGYMLVMDANNAMKAKFSGAPFRTPSSTYTSLEDKKKEFYEIIKGQNRESEAVVKNFDIRVEMRDGRIIDAKVDLSLEPFAGNVMYCVASTYDVGTPTDPEVAYFGDEYRKREQESVRTKIKGKFILKAGVNYGVQHRIEVVSNPETGGRQNPPTTILYTSDKTLRGLKRWLLDHSTHEFDRGQGTIERIESTVPGFSYNGSVDGIPDTIETITGPGTITIHWRLPDGAEEWDGQDFDSNVTYNVRNDEAIFDLSISTTDKYDSMTADVLDEMGSFKANIATNHRLDRSRPAITISKSPFNGPQDNPDKLNQYKIRVTLHSDDGKTFGPAEMLFNRVNIVRSDGFDSGGFDGGGYSGGDSVIYSPY